MDTAGGERQPNAVAAGHRRPVVLFGLFKGLTRFIGDKMTAYRRLFRSHQSDPGQGGGGTEDGGGKKKRPNDEET